MNGLPVHERIRRGTAVQAAADVLREEILSRLPYTDEQEWLLGSEDEVLERLGVSRPTVRQAIRLLEAEQLLVVRRGHRGGIWARVPSADGVVHAMSVYLRSQKATITSLVDGLIVIAPRCMALAAGNPDETGRRRLVAIAAELADLAEDPGGARRFAQLRLAYFQEVAALAGNPVLKLYFCIANGLIASTRQPLYLAQDDRRQAAPFYVRAAEAILSGNAAEAERLGLTFFEHLRHWLDRQAENHDGDWLALT